MKAIVRIGSSLLLLGGLSAACAESVPVHPYTIVDTGQNRCFSTDKEIAYPERGAAFHGQDAQYEGNIPAYKDNGDGTVSDRNTGLMWQKTPDLKNKTTHEQAAAGAKDCRLGGYSDWRVPGIKELYSLIDFRGYSNRTAADSKPYIDTGFFDFVYGDESKGERLIDAQYRSSTIYVGKTMNGNPTVFGVNFADGRIKGYPLQMPGGHQNKQFVRYVRGNPAYGKNEFKDNGDGTVSDLATGLMWTKDDSKTKMNWQESLKYAENLKCAGHNDWRLPNAKELQSIVDYTHAPEATSAAARGPAIDHIFNITSPESYFWTSTTHLEHRTCGTAAYVAFGRALGTMHGVKMDVHGAGAQRSDPKSGDPLKWKDGRGPQGDDIRIYNYVRCVRGGEARLKTSGPAIEGGYTAERGGPENRQQPGSSAGQPPPRGHLSRPPAPPQVGPLE